MTGIIKRPKTKEEKAADLKIRDERIAELAKLIGQPVILHADVRILRERLAWACKKAPAMIHKQLIDTLVRFAKAVASYCQCQDYVFIEKEKMYACLDCGARFKEPRPEYLKVVK